MYKGGETIKGTLFFELHQASLQHEIYVRLQGSIAMPHNESIQESSVEHVAAADRDGNVQVQPSLKSVSSFASYQNLDDVVLPRGDSTGSDQLISQVGNQKQWLQEHTGQRSSSFVQ